MNTLDLKLPDFSGHPRPPRMTFEEYQRWICEEIVPELARRGEMTTEKLREDFMQNEGRMTEFRYDG
ncbi:hypothetical protein [Luteolibacter marinus]|uniref:hypothetical protein n=1 Tax=Luteolibacter marinus TaxID=2776705 RepID=UPI001865DDBC|nr:hypothetical protein [Luteolibacter marinus]